MDESHSIIFDENQNELLSQFELDEQLFSELKNRQLFPHPYYDYLNGLKFTAEDKKRCLLMDLKHRPNAYRQFSDILKKRSGGVFTLLEEKERGLKQFYQTSRKLCVIVHNDSFDKPRSKPQNESLLNLKQTFRSLEYTVLTYSNLSSLKLVEILQKIMINYTENEDEDEECRMQIAEMEKRDLKYSDFDMFVLIVMSRGNSIGVKCSDGEEVVSYRDILDTFTEANCSHFGHKPKVFLFNCRRETEESLVFQEKGRTFPHDTFVIYSTLDSDGSEKQFHTLFAQTFTEALRENRDREVNRILQATNQKLNDKLEKREHKQQLKVQMLATRSLLRF